MGTSSLAATFLLQDATASASDVHIIMICIAVLTAIVILVLLAVAIAGLVIYGKINHLSKQINARTQPLIGKGQQIAGSVNDILTDLKPKIAAVSADLQPKIASVTSDVQHISSLVRSKVDEAGQTFSRVNSTVQGYNETAQEVNTKAKGQVARVNEMVSEALTTSQQVSRQIQHGIKVPVEKVASWVMAAKIGIENLADRIPFLKDQAPAGSARRPGAPYAGPVASEGYTPGPRIVRSALDEDTFDDR